MTVDEALKKGTVLITFKSLNSGKEISRLYGESPISSNPLSDKLIAVRIEDKTIEDIERKTIIKWQLVDE